MGDVRWIVVAPRVEKNPCADHVCGWGKECIVDKSGEPTCECISKCPPLDGDPFDQVKNYTSHLDHFFFISTSFGVAFF